MRTLTIFAITVFLFFGLSSCDPAVTYSRVIENNSNYDLEIVVDNLSGGVLDTVIIASGSEYVIEHSQHIGRTSDHESCQYNFTQILDLDVATIDTLDVIVDPNDSQYWKFTVLDSKLAGGGICECRLSLNDSAIQ